MMSTPPAPSHADGFQSGFEAPRPTEHIRLPKKTYLSTTTTPMINSPGQVVQKKIPRRSSKPIINWFQRKLAGSGKGKRTENVPLTIEDLSTGRSNSNRQTGRVTSSPLPSQAMQSIKPLARRKTRSISLNGDEDGRDFNNQPYADDDLSLEHSSINRESIWSPASALEADDDASVRPLPPSAPPSPSPSRSSSSYLSDPRTFRSMAASTKPTTLLSIDLNGNGMAHIAQAPNPPLASFHRFVPHVRQSSLSSPGLLGSASSITFSALPSTQPSSRPSSLRHLNSLSPVQAPHNNGVMTSVQAPLHTTHHPRNNPRPSSPPLDNASVLTLASSAFGMPHRPGAQNYPPSAIGDSASHYGGSITFPDAESTSHYVLGDDERLEERDFDASVRALRPRSSRRGSWESEVSRWSARVQGTGSPSLARERSLWTSNSIRTGGFSTEQGEMYETADDDQTTGEIVDDSEAFQDVNMTSEPPSEVISIIINQSYPQITDTTPGPYCDVKDTSEINELLRRVSTDTVAQPVIASTLPMSKELQAADKTPEVDALDDNPIPAER